MVDSEPPKFMPGKADVVHESRAPESTVNPFLSQYLERGPVKIASKEANLVSSPIGQIQKIDMPKNWGDQFKEPYSGIGHRSYSEVRLNGDKDVAMSFFYRGDALKDASQAKAFHDIVTAGPHQLSASELKSIPEVLQDKANPSDFGMLSARTQDLNGKNVLIVEGRYKALQQDAYHVFVDSDGTGKNVQEVFYQAPKDKYPAHLKEAKDALNTIQWK
jgi:hypothetical protein